MVEAIIWLLVTFLAALFFANPVIGLAKKFKALDVPDGKRKLHAVATPLWGGLIIWLAITFGFGILVLFRAEVFTGAVGVSQILGIWLAMTILLFGGLLDDIKPLRPGQSIIFPGLATVVAVLFGIGISKITNPLGGFFSITAAVSGLITFGWLMISTYTTKLLDGVDGLVGGTGVLGALAVAALALTPKFYQPEVAIIAAIVAGAILGFWRFNFPPAKIFLGESGSTMIGFTLGVLAVLGGSKFATILLILGVPTVDMILVVLTRAFLGAPLFSGDRRHLHLRLKDRGWSAKQILFLYLGLSFAFGFVGLFLQSWQKMVALVILGSIAPLLVLSFSLKKRTQII